VVRVGVEHLTQATLGTDVIAAVLGEHRKVQQRPDRRRRASRSSARRTRSPRPPRPSGRAGRRAGRARPWFSGSAEPSPCGASRSPRSGYFRRPRSSPARRAWSTRPHHAGPKNRTRSPCQADRSTSIPHFRFRMRRCTGVGERSADRFSRLGSLLGEPGDHPSACVLRQARSLGSQRTPVNLGGLARQCGRCVRVLIGSGRVRIGHEPHRAPLTRAEPHEHGDAEGDQEDGRADPGARRPEPRGDLDQQEPDPRETGPTQHQRGHARPDGVAPPRATPRSG
jgi:hypothetical protein